MEDSHEQKVNNLNRKSEIFIEQLKQFKTILESYQNDKLLDKLKVETSLIKDAFGDFVDAQSMVWATATWQQKNYFLEKCFEIENDYLNLLCEANNLIRDEEMNATSTDGVSSASGSGTGNLASSSFSEYLYIPRMRLPRFSGRYEDWINFANQFKSAIDKHRTLSDQMRLCYLKACLDSKTALFIQPVDDYMVAWKTLEELYLIECDKRMRSEGNN
ncbi:hypothetical protein M0804_008818 [Polistes exclamans]|nr:hypothetical protein M0804_008818 [Polistes exclamans]